MSSPAGALETEVVSALLPLSLLEAVRAHDRPGEVLEAEDLTVSLPRRLGLTGVVENQIQRYDSARRTGRGVAADELTSLLRLIMKRPDASAILSDAGRRLADARAQRLPTAYVRLLRLLPGGLLVKAYRRAARGLLRGLVGNGQVEVAGGGPTVTVTNGMLARGEAAGRACGVYTAALEHLAQRFAGTHAAVTHADCAGSGAAECRWQVHGFER